MPEPIHRTTPGPEPAHVLLVLGDQLASDLLARGLEADDLRVTLTSDAEAALACYARERPDVVLCDDVALGLRGVQLLRRIRAVDPEAAVVLVGGRAPVPHVVEAMKDGAADFLFRPLTAEVVRAAVHPLVARSEVGAAAGSAAR